MDASVDGGAGAGWEREEESKCAPLLDAFLRKSLRNFYFNSKDSKTPT